MNSTKKQTKEEFIAKAKEVHGDKYDYSKVEYINNVTPVIITCPIHGDFEQKPKNHKRGDGCYKCGRERMIESLKNKKRKINKPKKVITKEEFITRAKNKYGDKFDYSNINYIDYNTKVKIICKKHGEFWQKPVYHLQGNGCKECINEEKRERYSLGKDKFIEKSKELFNNFYTYDKVVYINNSNNVIITCPKHGDFKCTPKNHLKGRGCPLCKLEGHVYENRLYNLLLTIFDENEIIREYRTEWLTNNKSFDFYIPKYKLAIEHQGSQHFKEVKFFGNGKKFERTCFLDKEKYEESLKNDVKLMYFSFELTKEPDNYFSKVFLEKEKNNFINEIKNIIHNE